MVAAGEITADAVPGAAASGHTTVATTSASAVHRIRKRSRQRASAGVNGLRSSGEYLGLRACGARRHNIFTTRTHSVYLAAQLLRDSRPHLDS